MVVVLGANGWKEPFNIKRTPTQPRARLEAVGARYGSDGQADLCDR